MVKRVPVPEGKALFFPRAEIATGAPPEVPATVETVEERRETRQSAIFLVERHLDWLDDKCREARRRGGRAVRKAAVIRALLDVAIESSLDLTNLRDEFDLRERVRRALHP
ncbi:MAG: hypothetical protein ACYC4L_02610 [Chloroflexota bacterium]